MSKIHHQLAAVLTAITLSGVGGGLFSACSPETENVFGGSPAVRQQQAAASYAAILEGQKEGWVLDFYPSELEMGGIAYTARFSGGQVTLACEQPIDNRSVNGRFAARQEVTSDYRIVNGTGVVLTFDTYNALIHYWSQPSGTDFDGFASDYEFTFVSASPDSVVLRGVKHGNLLRMYPLTMPADEYLAQTADMRTTLDAINRRRAIVDGKSFPVLMMENHMTYADGDSQHEMPFVYTPTGLRFYQPVVLGGVPVMQMNYNETTGNLASADGHVQMPQPTTLERFCVTATQWHFVFGRTDAAYDMCDELRQLLKTATNQLGNEKFESLKDFYIGLNKLPRTEDQQRIVIGWTTAYNYTILYEVCYGLSMTVVDEPSFTIDIKSTERGNLFYNYTFLSTLIDFITDASPYVLSFDDAADPTTVRLTSKADPAKWFVLKR